MSTDRDEAPGLLALDRLSERLLENAGNLRVAVATNADERSGLAQLRYRQVVDHGWAPAGKLGDGEELDEHDEHALQIGAWKGGTPVGTMRIVLPAPGRLLPVEIAFGVAVEPRGRVAEAGRLVIAPEHRGDPGHHTWGALFARSWLELRARGCSVLAGAVTPRMVERLRGVGLPFEVLGAAVPYWGEDRHPVRLDPSGGDPRWFSGRAPTSARRSSSRAAGGR